MLKVNNMGGGGTVTDDATATAADILKGKTAYVNDEKITGTIPLKEAQTYTPKQSSQTIYAGQYLKGEQIIKGDANLAPENIRSGVTIFGKTGTAGEIKNGTVQSFVAKDEDIEPYTFVELVEHIKDLEGNPAASIKANIPYLSKPGLYAIKKIGNDKYFVVIENSKVAILSIKDDVMTMYEILECESSVTASLLGPNIVKMSEDLIAIISQKEAALSKLYISIFRVNNDNTITSVNEGQLLEIDGLLGNRPRHNAAIMPDGRVIIMCTDGDDNYGGRFISATLCSIDDSGAVSVESSSIAVSYYNAIIDKIKHVEPLSENKFMIIESNDVSNKKYYIGDFIRICEIKSDGTIDTNNSIPIGYNSAYSRLDKESFLFTYQDHNIADGYHSKAVVYRVNGINFDEEISPIKIEHYGEEDSVINFDSIMMLSETLFCYVRRTYDGFIKEHALDVVFINVSKNTIKVTGHVALQTTFATKNPFDVTLSGNEQKEIWFIYDYDEDYACYLEGAVVIGLGEIAHSIIPSVTKIDGVTKTTATATTEGQVWVLPTE